MKTIRNVLVVVFLMLLMASGTWAAGTITGAQYISLDQTAQVVVYTVTFGADASSPADVSLANIKDANGNSLQSLSGWWLFSFSVFYGATGPTDDTDFYINRVVGSLSYDILGAAGENTIDNATDTLRVYPATVTQILLGTEKMSFSNNLVNNAVCYILAVYYK